MDRFETYRYDVLVVGAGGAGLRAAIEAAAQGASVGLICKSLLGKAHTVMAEGGIAGSLIRRVRLCRMIPYYLTTSPHPKFECIPLLP